jgi:hypothetical protein
MVSQSMPLLAGGVADAGERLIESKLLEWLQSSAVSQLGDKGRLLLECGGLDCCLFVEDGGGSGCPKGEVVLAPGPALKRLGGLLRPMFFIKLDPILQGWWLSRLVNALWLGVSSTPKSGPTTSVLLLQRRRMICVFDSYDDDNLQQYNCLYSPCFLLLVF